MATVINAGRVAMVPKGEWSASTAYTRLDVVLYQGSAWVGIQDSTGQTPSNGSTYWQLLAGGVDSTNYYTKTQVDAKIAASSPVRVRATWNASTSAYVSETDVDTMYQSFYADGKVLELHLVNGSWNGLVLTCRGGHTDGNVRHMVFGGVGMGMIIEADVVDTAVTVVYDSIVDIWDELGGKQDTLVSGENIKTVNNESLLGSGDVTIAGGEDGKSAYQSYLDTTSDNPPKTEAEWVASLKGADGHDGVSLGEVAIVDNLTEGGSDKVLSAEMGKELGERISAIKDCIFTKEDDALCIITDNYMEKSTAPSIEVQQQSEGYLVTIVNHVSGAKILYSIDGSVPSIVYDQPFTISTAGETTIKATATEDGKLPSTVAQEIVVIVSSKVQAFCDRVLNDGGNLIFEDALGTQKAYSAHTKLLGAEPELDFLGYKGGKLAPTYLYSMNENCDADQLTSVYISDDGLIVASLSQAGKAKTNIKWTRYKGNYSTRFAPDITWNQDGTRVVNRDFKRLYLHAKNGFLNYQGETQGTNVYENGILIGFPSRNGYTGIIGGQNDTIFVNTAQKITIGAYSALNARTLFVKMADTGYAIEQVIIDEQAATSLGTTCNCGSYTGVGHAYMQMKENSPMLILAY